jgi:hypothetical protein
MAQLGLVISKWSRAVFADMRKGGLTAANCTCSIWEGFTDTMRNIAQWKRWFTDNADLITPVRITADIRRAKAQGGASEPLDTLLLGKAGGARPRSGEPSQPLSAGSPIRRRFLDRGSSATYQRSCVARWAWRRCGATICCG